MQGHVRSVEAKIGLGYGPMREVLVDATGAGDAGDQEILSSSCGS